MGKVLLVTSACPEVAPLTALQKFCGWSYNSDAKFFSLGIYQIKSDATFRQSVLSLSIQC